jgi:hypothetical protein
MSASLVSDPEIELLHARMKSITYHASLVDEVNKLQRMKIEQLERQLHAERASRLSRWNLSEKDVCRNCGLDTKYGQLFCSQPCLLEYRRARSVRRG